MTVAPAHSSLGGACAAEVSARRAITTASQESRRRLWNGRGIRVSPDRALKRVVRTGGRKKTLSNSTHAGGDMQDLSQDSKAPELANTGSSRRDFG